MHAMQAISWDKAVKEQQHMIKAHGSDITYDVLQELDVLHRCVTEALRMHPPLIMVLRCEP
jgi:sterol 14-demethylase